MNKARVIITAMVLAMISGCITPPQRQMIESEKANTVKPKLLNVTTYPYQFNIPITGYQNPAMGAPRTIRIDKLRDLAPTTNIFSDGEVLNSSIELVLGGNHRIPGKLIVRSGNKLKNMAVLSYSNGYADCLYLLSPMGEDENHFRYYKQMPNQKRAVLCDADRVTRIEQRSDGTLRVSSHSKDTGVEQWAGLFVKATKG